MREEILFPKISHTEHRSVKDALHDLPILKSGATSTLLNHKAMNHTQQMLDKMSFIKDGEGREKIPQNLRPKSGDVRKYIKYNSAKPSITVTGDMRKVFHYSQNRALTVRELARLQTFPDDFNFVYTNITNGYKMVGNAVPPLLAEKIADQVNKSFKNIIDGKDGNILLESKMEESCNLFNY